MVILLFVSKKVQASDLGDYEAFIALISHYLVGKLIPDDKTNRHFFQFAKSHGIVIEVVGIAFMVSCIFCFVLVLSKRETTQHPEEDKGKSKTIHGRHLAAFRVLF